MKSLNFNRESWHFKVATKWGGFPKWFETTNICEYSRAVVKGSFLALANGLLALVAIVGSLYWVAITIAWWTAGIVTGVFIEEPGPIVLSMIVGGAGLIAGGTYLIHKVMVWNDVRKMNKSNEARIAHPKPDSFVKKAWRSWMDKTCVRVTIS